MKHKWSIHQIYFYLVCFVTLIVVIVGITSVVRAVIQIAVPIPDLEYPPVYERPVSPDGEKDGSTLPEAVIQEEVERRASFNKDQAKKQSLYGPLIMLVGGLAQILVAAPVYIYHWRKIPLLSL